MADARARFLHYDKYGEADRQGDRRIREAGGKGRREERGEQEDHKAGAQLTPRRRKWRRVASVGEDEVQEEDTTAHAGKDEEEEEKKEEAFTTRTDHARLLGFGEGHYNALLYATPTADETAFGLPRVDLPQLHAKHQSSLQMIASAAREFHDMHRASSRNVADPEAMSLVAARRALWREFARTLWFSLLFVDAMYVLLSVPLRLGLFFDPWGCSHSREQWTSLLTVFSTLDVIGELTRAVFVWKLASKRRNTTRKRLSTTLVPAPTPTVASASSVSAENPKQLLPISLRPTRKSLFSMRDTVTTQANAAATHLLNMRLVALTMGVFPVEVIVATVSYNWLHAARVTKLVVVWFSLGPSYSALLLKCRRFRWAQWLSFSTLALPFYLFWLGLHLSACGFMLTANIECGLDAQYCVKTPIPGSWMLKDNMEHATIWRRYLRALYWASKTVTTLGQGDLVPSTLTETKFCIGVQFISGLWATSFLASCSFYFSRRDRDIENGVSTRLVQALRFLKSRRVPSTLALKIRSHYQHIQRTRNGIEEDQVLLNLPAHYRSQCSFFVKYRLLAKITFCRINPRSSCGVLWTASRVTFSLRSKRFWQYLRLLSLSSLQMVTSAFSTSQKRVYVF